MKANIKALKYYDPVEVYDWHSCQWYEGLFEGFEKAMRFENWRRLGLKADLCRVKVAKFTYPNGGVIRHGLWDAALVRRPQPYPIRFSKEDHVQVFDIGTNVWMSGIVDYVEYQLPWENSRYIVKGKNGEGIGFVGNWTASHIRPCAAGTGSE